MNTAFINQLSYPDFVAHIGQTNTPPGGKKTIENWAKNAPILSEDFVLDLACSTGFSSRYLLNLVNCKAVGIDIAASAIQQARKESENSKLEDHLNYQVEDACNMSFSNNTFNHILAGCNFGFIQNRNQALKECFRVLKDNGKLCVANFFYISTPPEEMLQSVFKTVNFMPDAKWTKEWWEGFFKTSFSFIQGDDFSLPVFHSDEIREATYKFIYLQSPTLQSADDEIKKACFERLFKDRLVLNNHRKHQMFNVEIWQKNER